MAADVLLRAVEGGVYVVPDYAWSWIEARRILIEAFGYSIGCTVEQASAVLRLQGFTVLVEREV